MNEVKNHATYQEQVEKLQSKGCIIDNPVFCKDVLENVGYYRLSAYFLPFKNNKGNYIDGLHFETVYKIYEFDRKLRKLLFTAIEVIEISFRTKLSYYHTEKYGPLGYLDASSFNINHNEERFKTIINREIENNKKVLFVKHHIDNYNGQFPLWVMSELFTFGTLSYFYNDLTTADKKNFIGKNFKFMTSWSRCCTDLRNICAHYGRLYYRSFSAMPAGFNLSESAKRRLWGTILVVRELYPSIDKWNNEFMPAIESLFTDYKQYISLYHLAFPEDWLIQLKK